MRKNKMVAMILAGGRGSRLFDLTKKVAKPAVPYGGKYRIIDFPLSNCSNSGIDIVGVLTQYESILLHAYVTGNYWGFDAADSGIYVLPPREKTEGFGLYRGTADAITQNIDFIDSMNAEHVLILSGDHIYKMDYAQMLKYHHEKQADVTIAVLEVPLKEASRFGIMNTDEEDRIVSFEEKPKEPKSNLASMGIYIFEWKLLRKALKADADSISSSHDFGKDVIPCLLSKGKRLFAYHFKGYWKDVGTIESLWEANMDLIHNSDQMDLLETDWKIYTEDVPTVPQYFGEFAVVKNAYINQGSHVDGSVENSVLFTNVFVDEAAIVSDSVLFPNVKIGKGAKVSRAIVDEGITIGDNATVGSEDSKEILLVAKNVKGGQTYV